MIPWIAVAQLGVVEAGWVAGLAVVGVPVENSLPASVILHLLLLIVCVPTGLGGLLFLQHSASREIAVDGIENRSMTKT